MTDNMDPRDRETAKWLGQVIQAGPDSPASSTKFLPTSNLTQDQATATSAAARAAEGRSSTSTSGLPSIARDTPTRATKDMAPPLSGELNRPVAVRASISSTSLVTGQRTAAQRASRLAAAGAESALNQPTQTQSYKTSRLSSAGAAASLAAGGHNTTGQRQSQQRLNELALERSAASRAAILAARDSSPYEVPEHRLSSNAGKAALLAHKDHREYEVPEHQLSSNAGKAALLAANDHVEYQVPEHELSANAGKAALLAAHDHVEYEVPAHQLSTSASSAALLAHKDHKEYEVPEHELSANAGKAALLAHKDHREYEVPEHELSANAGKAALLAHQDHREYQLPPQTLSANAGKAALLAHRESTPVSAPVNPTSAASAANALKAATQAHHDPAMRPTKPEDLQAKGAANALRAASQAHREAPAPFVYVHPSDDPKIGKLARNNTDAYLVDMEPRTPHQDTVSYANISYSSAKARQSQADTYRAVSDEAYRSAGLSYDNSSIRSESVAPARPRTNTASTVNKGPVDLMALARRNVDAQMAERGLSRTASQQTVSTIGNTANRGANLAFKDGQQRQADSLSQRESQPLNDREISERINREMAQFDQQRKRNQNNTMVQSALMEAAKRNARLSMAQMEANRPYTAPSLRDTQRMEDLLNEEKMRTRRDAADNAQVDIGGGHYMSQVEIEAVAARRVQPVMAEMDEHVAEINRRKAEIAAQRAAEEAQREKERAERQRQKELQREEERKRKAAEKEARAEAKAKEKAAREALEQKRREEAEAKRAAERQRREEYEAARAAEKEEALRAAQAKKEAAAAAAATETTRAASTEAVATAQTTTAEVPRASTSSRTEHLPGTNAAIAGQELATTDAATTTDTTTAPAATDDVIPAATAVDAEVTHQQPVHVTAEPTLHRSETMDSSEPVATYQVETRGMVTDTEGETDDEWADAMEETPAIERAEYISVTRLTDNNLASRQIIREESGEDAETASIATAKPTRDSPDLTTPATTSAPAAATEVEEDEPLAPPLSRVNVGETRFKEELA